MAFVKYETFLYILSRGTASAHFKRILPSRFSIINLYINVISEKKRDFVATNEQCKKRYLGDIQWYKIRHFFSFLV